MPASLYTDKVSLSVRLLWRKMGLFGKQRIVLALGGGSARGLCSIGVLKALEKHYGKGNLPFDMVIGTSIGSLIGAGYCLGMPVEEMEKRALRVTMMDLMDVGVNRTGLVKGNKLEKLIKEIVDDRSFEDMSLPFALTTTDIENGEELVHRSGDLVSLIRASCSWPGIFAGVEVGGRLLVDGGVRNSIPTKHAYELGASFVVAVNPGFAVKSRKINNVLEAIVQSVQIMGEELNSYQAGAAEISIKPHLADIEQFDFTRTPNIIEQGGVAAENIMPRLKRRISLHKRCSFFGRK
jgi:NTE family protein